MITSPNAITSSIKVIHAAIKEENPFLNKAVVKGQEIWNENFPDVTSFNAHASDAVFQAINQVRNSRKAYNKVTSMVITADKGSGKSHIISRIRHRLKDTGESFFVYAGTEKYDLNRVNSAFLQTLVESLEYEGGERVTQWQEIAASIANRVWEVQNPHAEFQPAIKLKETYNNPINSQTNNQWVDGLALKFCKIKKTDPDLVRAILWTLSDNYGSFAVNWLSGKTLAETKANAMELPNPNPEDPAQESRAFESASQILSLIGDYKPVVICFDEVDLNNQPNKDGLRRSQAIASLIKPLVNDLKLSSESKGVIILTVMLPDTFPQIEAMPGGMIDRVSMRGEPIDLNFMDSESIVQLVSLWLGNFYDERNLVSPNPIYPFNESQLRQLGKNGNSARRVLEWCFNNFKVPADGSQEEGNNTRESTKQEILLPSPVEAAYKKELVNVEASLGKLLEDKYKISFAIRSAFETLIGKTIEGVEINSIEEIEPKKDNNSYIDFKIVGKENGKVTKIGVAVLQQSGGTSIAAGLKRLIDYKKYKLTRGCLVRSKEINQTAAQAQQFLSKLLSSNGEWIKLEESDIKPLLAVSWVICGSEDYELSQKEIHDYVEQKKLAINNPIIREILSNPSGQVPTGLTEE